MTAVGEWLSAGGVFVMAGCLASLATLIIVLSVAVCIVRSRLRRRRRRKILHPTTKIELHETSPAPAVQDPLLGVEMGQLSDVTLTELDCEPVRYVVGHSLTVQLIVC